MIFNKQVETYSQQHELLRPGDHYLLGVSGGVDSIVLLHYFVNNPMLNKQLTVVHVNHQLRPEADMEAKFVREICEAYDVPFMEKIIDVQGIQKSEKIGLEEAARQGRYRCFEEVMVSVEASSLVLAHHADDQVETILMRLTRGSQGSGYAGMPIKRAFSRGQLIRPFLAVTKKDIMLYAKANKLKHVEDASNAEDDATRNRFRHHVVPLLQQENQQVAKQFSAFHEEQTDLSEFATTMMLKQIEDVILKEDKRYVVQIEKFKKLHKIIQTLMIRQVIRELLPDNSVSISKNNIIDVLDLLKAASPSAKLYLPSGLQLFRVYDEAYFQFDNMEKSERFYYEMQPLTTVQLPGNGSISCEILTEDSIIHPEKTQLVLNATDIEFPLIIRSRLPGDRIKLKKTGGTRKLKNILIDEKIPQHLRDGIPVVTDATGEIIWLPTLKHSAFLACVNKKQQQYLIQYNSL